MPSENNKRIAKNTLMLYIRMLLTMGVSLYTSRVVLATLGVEDFGIYGVVGGVVSMFSFLNLAMVSSTQRYLTFGLGKNNREWLSKIFSTTILIHCLIALIIVILTETVGLWFLYNKMTIPLGRLNAAFWVLQFSVLSTVVVVMTVPYNATIIAHEKMSAFAYISLLEVTLKLVVVYLLTITKVDRLIFYAVLILLVQLLIRMIYHQYCIKHFNESRFHWSWNRPLLKEISSFAGWNLFGNLAAITFTQGLNLLLNVFFGPVLNAARAVAVQVQSAVVQFSSNFQTALNPQITKTYAMNELSNMHLLIYRSSKYSFFMLYFLSLPILFETTQLLHWWLKEVPAHTVNFIRIILFISMIDATANPLMIAAQATGRIRLYQSVIGGILLLILPISYVVLKMGGNPEAVFIVHLAIVSIAWIVRLYIIHPMIQIPISQYLTKVMGRVVAVGICSFMLVLAIRSFMQEGIIRFLTTGLSSVFFVALFIYLLGLEKGERNALQKYALRLVKRIGKNG